jgi:hypothetical protein
MPVALPHLAGLDVHLCVADWLRDALSGKKPRNLKREAILREKTGSGPYEEQMVDYRLPGRVGKG